MIKVFDKDNIEYNVSELKRLGNKDYVLVTFKSSDIDELIQYCNDSRICKPTLNNVAYDKETDTYTGIYTCDIWRNIEDFEELIKTLIHLKTLAWWKKKHD